MTAWGIIVGIRGRLVLFSRLQVIFFLIPFMTVSPQAASQNEGTQTGVSYGMISRITFGKKVTTGSRFLRYYLVYVFLNFTGRLLLFPDGPTSCSRQSQTQQRQPGWLTVPT